MRQHIPATLLFDELEDAYRAGDLDTAAKAQAALRQQGVEVRFLPAVPRQSARRRPAGRR
jgi:hypothetical protein